MKIKTGFLLLLIVGCKPAAENVKESTIEVTGYSKLSLPPDQAIIKLNTSYESASKDSVLLVVNREIRGILDSIKGTGIKTEDLSTGAYNMYFQKERKTKRLIYHGTQPVDLSFRLILSDIERVVNAVKGFKNTNLEINYNLSTHKQDSVELVLTAMALKDAERKAKYIAEHSSLKIEKIGSISHSSQWSASRNGGVDYETFDEIGNSVNFDFNLIPRPIDLTDNVVVTYVVSNKQYFKDLSKQRRF